MSDEIKESAGGSARKSNEKNGYTVDEIIAEYISKHEITAGEIKKSIPLQVNDNDKKEIHNDSIKNHNKKNKDMLMNQRADEISDVAWSSSQLSDIGFLDESVVQELEDTPVPDDLRNARSMNAEIIYADDEEDMQENNAEFSGYEDDDKNLFDQNTYNHGKHKPEKEDYIEHTEVNDMDNNDNKIKNTLLSFLPHKGDRTGEIIRKIIFLISIAVLIYGSAVLISTFIQSRIALADQDDIKDRVTMAAVTGIDENGNIITLEPTEEQKLEHSKEVIEYYQNINSDVAGFLTIENCNIYMPVMQGDDNEYYLTHTYRNSTNKAGSIFMDYRCKISEDYMSPNIVLYGHNQKDGTMFGNLKDYKNDIDYYKKNPVIEFDTAYGIGEYVIYGCFVTNTLEKQDRNGEVFHYHDYIEVLNDKDTFNWYVNQIQERNEYVTPVDVQFGDQLLILSTCSDEFSNLRFVICARKLRDGETIDSFDFDSITKNSEARTIDYYAITSNITTYQQRTEPSESTDISEMTENADETELSSGSDTDITDNSDSSSGSDFTSESSFTEQNSNGLETSVTEPPQADDEQTTVTVSADINN